MRGGRQTPYGRTGGTEVSKNRWSWMVLLGALALLLAACSGGLGDYDASLAEFEVARSAVVAESGEYLVVHRGASNARLRRAIAAAGGEIVREIPQIGVSAGGCSGFCVCP